MFTTESRKKPEQIIICEQQEGMYCGRHALRALTQRRDLFNDEYLKEVAQNIAAAEQISRRGDTVRLTDYYYENTGEYDIQVIKAALMNVFNIDLIQIHTLEPNNGSIQSLILANIHNCQGFLIQENYHYYCLRRFRMTKDYFFKIDSKYPTYHESIHCEHIFNFLHTLLEDGSNIYVVVQYISDHVDDQLSTDNIETRLWCLPDAPADLEPLTQGD